MESKRFERMRSTKLQSLQYMQHSVNTQKNNRYFLNSLPKNFYGVNHIMTLQESTQSFFLNYNNDQ
jgi:hypothetical protein